MVKKFNVVTPELYKMAVEHIAWYDDVVSFGYGDYLSKLDFRTLHVAESIIKLYYEERKK